MDSKLKKQSGIHTELIGDECNITSTKLEVIGDDKLALDMVAAIFETNINSEFKKQTDICTEFSVDEFNTTIVKVQKIADDKLAHDIVAKIMENTVDFNSDDDLKYDDDLENIRTNVIGVESAFDQVEFARIQKEIIMMAAEKQEQAKQSKNEIKILQNKLKEQQNFNKNQIKTLHIIDNKDQKSTQLGEIKYFKKQKNKQLLEIENNYQEVEKLKTLFEEQNKIITNELEIFENQKNEQLLEIKKLKQKSEKQQNFSDNEKNTNIQNQTTTEYTEKKSRIGNKNTTN